MCYLTTIATNSTALMAIMLMEVMFAKHVLANVQLAQALIDTTDAALVILATIISLTKQP
jgi:hypothetical protein